MPFDAIIYDLDGTLLNTLQDLADAFNGALEDQGLAPHPVEAYNQFVGDGARMAVVRALPQECREDDALVAACLDSFRDRYEKNWQAHTRPYPGVVELVQKVHARGIPQAVLTNKPHPFAVRLVEAMFPAGIFAVIQGLDEGIAKKPDPTAALQLAARMGAEPAGCAFVGDTRTDMGTAVAAGMYPIGVLWGFRSQQELLHHGAQALATNAQELVDRLMS